MAKYYVQSGTLRTVIQAESIGKAAIWAVHQAMQQVFPTDGRPRCSIAGEEKPVAVLDEEVTISELGFDRLDATSMPTLQVVGQWNEMIATLDRLEKMLYQAA